LSCLIVLLSANQKPKCVNHKAANEKISGHKNVDIKAILGSACGHHGCVVPCSMVNMYGGERYVICDKQPFKLMISSRQMYSDYSFCQAVKYWKRTGDADNQLAVLLNYDIGCEWWIHFLWRTQHCEGLDWDEKTELIVAVGKWHLAAHVKDCFCKFSLNFIKGAGHLDGEIMETIWSKLNEPGRTARAMTLAHREEFLNRFIQDINFKKMVSMGE